jgi:hypothetical protein
MAGLVPDKNAEGQFNVVLQILQREPWAEFWADLQVQVTSFRSLGLADTAADAVVWQTCQAEDVILFTGNRNAEGPDSLEAVIQRDNQSHHLPVITVGNLTSAIRPRIR